MAEGRTPPMTSRGVACGARHATSRHMHVTAFMIMRELIEKLEHNRQHLRASITDKAERDQFDHLAKLTIHRATGAVDIYEEEPFRERPAIGAMYAACDVALRLLHAFEQVPAREGEQQRLNWAMRDLRMLISELFEWVVVPGGEPMLEIER